MARLLQGGAGLCVWACGHSAQKYSFWGRLSWWRCLDDLVWPRESVEQPCALFLLVPKGAVTYDTVRWLWLMLITRARPWGHSLSTGHGSPNLHCYCWQRSCSRLLGVPAVDWGLLAHSHDILETNSMILCFSKATCFTLASASALSGPCTRVDLNFFPTYEATARLRGFPGGPSGKEPVCQCRRHKTWVRSPDWEDPPEQDMATPSSILAWRIPMDRGACWATVHGVAKSPTRLSDWACAHARLRVSVPWIWRWHRPVTGSLQICLEGWVSGIQIREPVLSISLHSALAGTTPQCWWCGAERTLLNTPPTLSPPPGNALLLFTWHAHLSLALLPGSGAPQNGPTWLFHYMTDTLLQKNNCVLIHCC